MKYLTALFVLAAVSAPGSSSEPVSVTIVPADDPHDVQVVLAGLDSTPFSRDAANGLGLTQAAMRKGMAGFTGIWYSYVWCPSADEAAQIGFWREYEGKVGHSIAPVTMQTKPVSHGPVTVAFKPAIVDHVVWDNSGSSWPRTFTASVNTSVTESVTSTWSEAYTRGVSATVSVKVTEAGAEAGASTTVSLSDTVSKGGTASTTVNVGSTGEISGEVPAGRCQVAALTASRGILSVDVEYDATPTGNCMGVWTHHHSGHVEHNFQPANISGVLQWAGLPRSNTAKQTVQVDFYADANLAVHDLPNCATQPKDIDAAVIGR